MNPLQSAGAAKEKKLKGKKQKKKDRTLPTNPKQKYYQRTKNKTQPAIVDPAHKQRAPLFIPLAGIEQEDREQAALVVDKEEDDVGDGSSEQAAHQEPLLVVEDLEDDLDQDMEDGGASEEEEKTEACELKVSKGPSIPVSTLPSDRVQEHPSVADANSQVKDIAQELEAKSKDATDLAGSGEVELLKQQGLTGGSIEILTEEVMGSEGAVSADTALEQAPGLEVRL